MFQGGNHYGEKIDYSKGTWKCRGKRAAAILNKEMNTGFLEKVICKQIWRQ